MARVYNFSAGPSMLPEKVLATAAACLASGSDAIIVRHQASVTALSAMIAALI